MKNIVNLFLKNSKYMYVAIFLILIIINIVYTYFTKFTVIITVDKTYSSLESENYSRHGSNIHKTLMVNASNGKIYEVDNSVLYWKWNREEEWAKLHKGKKYKITGYGIRVGLFTMYPKILSVTPI